MKKDRLYKYFRYTKSHDVPRTVSRAEMESAKSKFRIFVNVIFTVLLITAAKIYQSYRRAGKHAGGV